MTINKAIEIVERWLAGNYATRIENMTPALKLLIEAGKRVKDNPIVPTSHYRALLPGETK